MLIGSRGSERDTCAIVGSVGTPSAYRLSGAAHPASRLIPCATRFASVLTPQSSSGCALCRDDGAPCQSRGLGVSVIPNAEGGGISLAGKGGLFFAHEMLIGESGSERDTCAIIESSIYRKGDPSSGCALCRDDGARRVQKTGRNASSTANAKGVRRDDAPLCSDVAIWLRAYLSAFSPALTAAASTSVPL